MGLHDKWTCAGSTLASLPPYPRTLNRASAAMPHTDCRKAANFECRVICLSPTRHVNGSSEQVTTSSSIVSGFEAASD